MPSDASIDHGLRRYVVLHHTGIDEPHFDLLFDTADDSPLIAFRVQHWPPIDQPATKLRDHRRLYLTYEGPIPGARGHVTRVADGRIKVIETAAGWLLQHPDGRLFAALELRGGLDSDQWWMTTPTEEIGA
jgi:hypothetical protein